MFIQGKEKPPAVAPAQPYGITVFIVLEQSSEMGHLDEPISFTFEATLHI